MHIIDIYTHPKHGRMYLWSPAAFEYKLGSVSKNIMEFEGYTLDEAIHQIKKHGFTRINSRSVKGLNQGASIP